MKLLKAIITLCAMGLLSAQSYAQEKPDILQMFDQFLLTNYAVSQCSKPDAETFDKFLANFQIVTIRAAEEVRKRNASSSNQNAQQFMKSRSTSQNKQVTEIIQSRGCNDPRIQDLLKKFQMQANLKL